MSSTLPLSLEENGTSPVIKQASVSEALPDTALAIADCRWFVRDEAGLIALADEMAREPLIGAVAVVDQDDRLIGQISRTDLFDLLGRPFGRDVLAKETAARFARPVPAITAEQPILGVCATLGRDRRTDGSRHFPLTDVAGRYCGTFSIESLLRNLAERQAACQRQSRVFHQRILRESQFHEDEISVLLATAFRQGACGPDFWHLRRFGSEAWLFHAVETPEADFEADMARAQLHALVNAAAADSGLAAHVGQVNATLHRSFQHTDGRAGFFMEYRAADGRLLVADHGAAIGLVWRNGKLLRLKPPAERPRLGRQPALAVEVLTHRLQPGDLLLALGRGFDRATDQNGTPYGPARLRALLEVHGAAPPKDIAELVRADFAAFVNNGRQGSDAVLAIIRHKGTGA